MLFAGAQAAAALARERRRDRRAVPRRPRRLYPRRAALVADAIVHRWPLGNVYARPGRAALQRPLEGALGPHRNLHLAGDYFAELGNMEAAARTGDVAARRVERTLASDKEPSMSDLTPFRGRPARPHHPVHRATGARSTTTR